MLGCVCFLKSGYMRIQIWRVCTVKSVPHDTEHVAGLGSILLKSPSTQKCVLLTSLCRMMYVQRWFYSEFNVCSNMYDFAPSQLVWKPVMVQYASYVTSVKMWKLEASSAHTYTENGLFNEVGDIIHRS